MTRRTAPVSTGPIQRLYGDDEAEPSREPLPSLLEFGNRFPICKTADMIDATRRILVYRIARKIENETLLVTSLAGWLKVCLQRR